MRSDFLSSKRHIVEERGGFESLYLAEPDLKGLRVAILVDNGFEQVEMTEPRRALEQAGAKASIISPAAAGDKVRGWNHKEWGDEFQVDVPLQSANPDNYDALLLPGGVMNPDKLRIIPEAVEFVNSFFVKGKPVAAICHGPWTIINANQARGRKMTSWPSLKVDLQNAGANWVDKELVVDGNLVTSRKPADLPAFNRGMLDLFANCQRARKVSEQTVRAV